MATKNNLDVGGEAPHHTELAARYRIGDGVYDLTQIVAAVKGEQSNDDWNARTMGDRLDALKGYLKDQDAEKVEDEQASEPEQPDTGAAQPDEPALNDEAVKLVEAASKAEGPVDTLRAFGQNPEADAVEELIASNQRLVDVIDAVRARLGLTDEDNSTVMEALDALFEKANAKPAVEEGSVADRVGNIEKHAGVKPDENAALEDRVVVLERALGYRR
jgi:hypothetical protein